MTEQESLYELERVGKNILFCEFEKILNQIQTPDICLFALKQDSISSYQYVNIVLSPDFETTYQNLLELKIKEDREKQLYNSL